LKYPVLRLLLLLFLPPLHPPHLRSVYFLPPVELLQVQSCNVWLEGHHSEQRALFHRNVFLSRD
jgi:hypothetical protein